MVAGAEIRGESSAEPSPEGLVIERQLERRFYGALQLADFMAIMMVLATGFSAYATWRSVQIANAVYLTAERPYIGVESVKLKPYRPGDPRVEIDYRNFGSVAAQSTRIMRRMKIDGALVDSQTRFEQAGIMSPGTPHRMHLHIPAGSYNAIVSGKSSLQVEVIAAYQNPRGEALCYWQRFKYFADADDFDLAGGTTDCNQQRPLWGPEAAGDSKDVN